MPDIHEVLNRIYNSDKAWWPYGLKRSMLDKAWLINDPESGQPAGFTGWQFRQQDGQKMAFYAVGVLPEFRRKGLAKRALTEMFDRHLPADVAGVRAFIVPSNAPSLSLAAKLGVQVQHKAASLRAASRASKVGAMKLARNMPTGYNGVSLQQYMPLVARRPVLQPAEQDAIAEGKSQWLPQIFTFMADSPAVDMHSPGKGALMASLLGAAAAGGGAHRHDALRAERPRLHRRIRRCQHTQLDQFADFNLTQARGVGQHAERHAAAVIQPERVARDQLQFIGHFSPPIPVSRAG